MIRGTVTIVISALDRAKKAWFPNEKGEKILHEIIERIKLEEKDKDLIVLLA